MERSRLLQELADQITRIELSHPTRIAIDGIDAAGKTTLAQELAAQLRADDRQVIRASIDGFHNPTHIRHSRGATSPEGYYHDSFDYQRLVSSLLAPLGPGGSHHFRSAVFDYRTNVEVQAPVQAAEQDALLLFDGVFLLRPELVEYWDFAVLVESTFDTALARAEERDAAMFGSREEVRRRYERRYIPGQELYFAHARPRERANVIVDNNDPRNPVVTRGQFVIDASLEMT